MKNIEVKNVAHGCIDCSVWGYFADERFAQLCKEYEENQPRFDTTVTMYDDDFENVLAKKEFKGYDMVIRRTKYESLEKDYFLLKEYVEFLEKQRR